MVVIVLPEWTIELEEKLNKVIEDIVVKNKIDLIAVEDSKDIESGKNLISNALVRLYENYGIEERKRLEEFEKDMKKDEKLPKKKGKKKKKYLPGSKTESIDWRTVKR
jgi:hypothetical protein